MTAGNGPVRSTRAAQPPRKGVGAALAAAIEHKPTEAQLTEMVARLTAELSSAYDEGGRLAADAANARERQAELLSEVNDLTTERDSLRESLGDATRTIGELESERNAARTAQAESFAREAATVRQRDSLATQLGERDNKIQELGEQVSLYRAEVDRMIAEREQHELTLTAAHHDRDAAQERAATALNEQARKQVLADGYRRERDALDQNYAKLLSRYDALSDIHVDVLKQRDVAVAAHQGLTTVHNDLHKRVSALLGERAAHQTTLAADIGHARKQLSDAKDKLTRPGFRKSRAREQHAAALAWLAALEAVAGRVAGVSGGIYLARIPVTAPRCVVRPDGTAAILLDEAGENWLTVDDAKTAALLAEAADELFAAHKDREAQAAEAARVAELLPLPRRERAAEIAEARQPRFVPRDELPAGSHPYDPDIVPLSPPPETGPGASPLDGMSMHDWNMPHDTRYPADDPRGCPPNCPYLISVPAHTGDGTPGPESAASTGAATPLGVTARRPGPGTRIEFGADPLRACDCPVRDGNTYHQRETCTDPVAARLGWYADDQPDTSGPVLVPGTPLGHDHDHGPDEVGPGQDRDAVASPALALAGEPWEPAAGDQITQWAAHAADAATCAYCEAPLNRDGSCSRSCVGVGDG